MSRSQPSASNSASSTSSSSTSPSASSSSKTGILLRKGHSIGTRKPRFYLLRSHQPYLFVGKQVPTVLSQVIFHPYAVIPLDGAACETIEQQQEQQQQSEQVRRSSSNFGRISIGGANEKYRWSFFISHPEWKIRHELTAATKEEMNEWV